MGTVARLGKWSIYVKRVVNMVNNKIVSEYLNESKTFIELNTIFFKYKVKGCLNVQSGSLRFIDTLLPFA